MNSFILLTIFAASTQAFLFPRIDTVDKLGEVRINMKNQQPIYRALDYFIGEYNVRPAKGNTVTSNTIPDFPSDWVDDSASDANLQSEERPFKNLVVGQNGLNFTFAPDSQQCFGEEGDFVKFTVDVA